MVFSQWVVHCAHHFVDQGPKGEKHWSYQLKEVYFIGVMDFKLPNSRPGKYFHRAAIMHEETHEILCNKLGFIFLELPNFNLEEKDIKSDLERWFYVLRNLGKLEKIPVILHKRIFQKLFHIAELSQLKKEEYMLYQKDLKDQWDAYNQLQTAREEGFEEGEARGEAKGLAKGLAEGEEKKSREFIENLILKLNLDNQKTADLAGVSVDFVRKVRAGLKKKK
ncbi:hypothetical protein GCM10027051_25470 [Niabella terrae]